MKSVLAPSRFQAVQQCATKPLGGEVRDFGAGDVLVIYSDGIPEAPVGNEFYGDERLAAKVIELTSGTRPVAEIATALLDDVRRLAEERLATDDVTLVVLRRL